MVYMTLPKQLTDSELELQRKFAQLRKLVSNYMNMNIIFETQYFHANWGAD